MTGTPLLIADILERTGLVRAGMSTRRGGVSRPPLGMNLSLNVGDEPEHVAENRRRFLGALGATPDRLALPGQVHGPGVRSVHLPGHYPECDALMTDVPGLVIAVTVADCVPILMVDPVRRVIAAIHAGWRGTASGIVRAAVAALQEGYRVSPADLLVWIGPAASVCCYTVGDDVASRFPPDEVHRRTDGVYVDLKSANRAALLDCGIPEASVEVSPLCTISEVRLLHSYRRDGARSGRMMAALTLAFR